MATVGFTMIFVAFICVIMNFAGLELATNQELDWDREFRVTGVAQPAERLPEILQMVNAQMVRVEGGSFTMGCTPEQENCDDDEKPPRRVQINSFEIGTRPTASGTPRISRTGES